MRGSVPPPLISSFCDFHPLAILVPILWISSICIFSLSIYIFTTLVFLVWFLNVCNLVLLLDIFTAFIPNLDLIINLTHNFRCLLFRRYFFFIKAMARSQTWDLVVSAIATDDTCWSQNMTIKTRSSHRAPWLCSWFWWMLKVGSIQN